MRFLPFALLLCACEIPTPNAPAEPIGAVPQWGQGFATQGGAAPNSAFGPQGTVTAPPPAPDATAPTPPVPGAQGGSLTPNQPNPFANEQWGAGDAAYGKQVFLALCARCHGANGEGGAIPGTGPVPALADKAWQQKTDDKAIASVIAHGKNAMPSFMQDMDKRQIDGVIAYIRSLAP